MYSQVNQKAPFGWLVFATYIVFLILLPSGSIYGINVKIITFVLLVLVSALLIAQERYAAAHFSFAAAVITVLGVWTVFSLINTFYSPYALMEAKDVLTTLAGCWFIRFFASRERDRKKFIRLCLYGVAFGCVTKVLILMYALTSGVAVSAIIQHISAAFGVTLMTIEFGDLGGRLQFGSDNLLPICLFVMIGLRKQLSIRALPGVVMVALFVFSSLYTFSRFIWLSSLLAAGMGMLMGRRDKIVYGYIAILGVATAYFFPLLRTVIAFRFSSSLAGSSDIERDQQIPALKELFWRSPLFGNGLGSYALQLKRSGDVPYAYEVQVLAILAQVGLIGSGLLLFLLVNYYRKAFCLGPKPSGVQISIFFLLLDILGAGFFNPSLLSSMSAVGYGLLFVLALTNFKGEDSNGFSQRPEAPFTKPAHPAELASI